MQKTPAIIQRLGATTGMLGILFVSLLLPWHVTFCAMADGAGAARFQIICKADAAADHSRLRFAADAPLSPSAQCPVCLGLAGLQLAAAAGALLSLTLTLPRATFFLPPFAAPSGALRPLPSIRGPPPAR